MALANFIYLVHL